MFFVLKQDLCIIALKMSIETLSFLIQGCTILVSALQGCKELIDREINENN